MKKTLYSLQGIIFQSNKALTLGYKPGIGTAVMIQDIINYSMFHSIVSTDDENPSSGLLTGAMHDRWGDSIITDFRMTPNHIGFTKTYFGRPAIYFNYPKHDVHWEGKYHGADCGSGNTKIMVIEIEESFFELPEV